MIKKHFNPPSSKHSHVKSRIQNFHLYGDVDADGTSFNSGYRRHA